MSEYDGIVLSPTHQFLYAQFKTASNETVYRRLGYAINMFVNTVRGRVPIFVFGKSDAAAIIKGSQFIYGTIDQLVINKNQFDEAIELQKEITYELTTDSSQAKKVQTGFLGVEIGISTAEQEMDIDNIRIDKLILVGADRKYTVDLVKVGNEHKLQEGVHGMALELYDVEFYGYSYQKRTTDVQQLVRVNFLARQIKQIDETFFVAKIREGGKGGGGKESETITP